ncbi:uncharacterized protein LOC125167326 [Prionailurus viverrinus]|uniref:uncharacterized protein LOC125167326 n=1 Tax=Prionailurus viverrinus TaxID=61388 RepID=UPI001FF3A9E7|nr:uncharacterized protein LOC125167326 [Prionailurus viverrinus]
MAPRKGPCPCLTVPRMGHPRGGTCLPTDPSSLSLKEVLRRLLDTLPGLKVPHSPPGCLPPLLFLLTPHPSVGRALRHRGEGRLRTLPGPQSEAWVETDQKFIVKYVVHVSTDVATGQNSEPPQACLPTEPPSQVCKNRDNYPSAMLEKRFLSWILDKTSWTHPNPKFLHFESHLQVVEGEGGTCQPLEETLQSWTACCRAQVGGCPVVPGPVGLPCALLYPGRATSLLVPVGRELLRARKPSVVLGTWWRYAHSLKGNLPQLCYSGSVSFSWDYRLHRQCPTDHVVSANHRGSERPRNSEVLTFL